MLNNKFYIIIIICGAFMVSCGGKDADTEASPDINIEDQDFSEISNIYNCVSVIKFQARISELFFIFLKYLLGIL